jgi:hypothetical protein
MLAKLALYAGKEVFHIEDAPQCVKDIANV